MLDPDVVLAEVTAALRSIPAVIAQLGGDPSNLIPHFYYYGTEDSVAMALYKMTAGQVLLAYKDLLGGGQSGFDQSTLWKHRLDLHIRPSNRSSPVVGGQSTAVPVPASPLHLWWLLMNSPLGTGTGSWDAGLCIRKTRLLSGSLDLMDTPTLTFRQDENGADLFIGSLTFPEYGDQ